MIPLTATTDWLSVVLTFVTTIVALYLLRQGQKDRKASQQEREADRQQKRRQQASRVFVSEPLAGGRQTEGSKTGLTYFVEFEINNGSDDILTDVKFEMVLYEVPYYSGQTEFFRNTMHGGLPRRMKAGEVQRSRCQFDVPARRTPDPNGDLYVPCQAKVSVEFTDSAGVSWKRNPDHSLEEVIQLKTQALPN